MQQSQLLVRKLCFMKNKNIVNLLFCNDFIFTNKNQSLHTCEIFLNEYYFAYLK